MTKTSIFELAQLIICADILLHKYSKLKLKDKIELVRKLEQVKKIERR